MKSFQILLALVREGLLIDHAEESYVVSLSLNKEILWQEIYAVASQQGMAAITFDGLKQWMLLPEFKEHFPKTILFKWMTSALVVEKDYLKQWKSAILLSNLYYKNDIRTVVLKGFAIAQNYPFHNHRPCCDLDCFLFDDYEKGNKLVEGKGESVSYDFYKHAEFNVKGLHVENHRFCTAIRGSRRAKDFERFLQKILKEGDLSNIRDSHLLCPPPMFNALFLTKHTLAHFLSEGITLRHMSDWAMFVQTNVENMDWNEFLEICKEYGLYRFADALTGLCVALFQIKAPFAIRSLAENQHLILNDTLALQDKERVNAGSFWQQRMKLITNVWRDRWKYKYFSDETYWQTLMCLVRGYLFDREPKI